MNENQRILRTKLDMDSYQTAETAWRWDQRVFFAQERIAKAEMEIERAKEDLAFLEAHPPLYHLFNWSA